MFVFFFFYFHIQGEPGSDGAAGKDVSVALWERGRTSLYVAGFIYFPLRFFLTGCGRPPRGPGLARSKSKC